MKKVFAVSFILTLFAASAFASDGHGHDQHHDGHHHEDHHTEEAPHGDHHENAHQHNEVESHAAHEHGVAELDIVLEDGQVQIELRSPAMNIVGFEHRPENKKQRQAVKGSMQKLRHSKLFDFIGDKQCKAQDIHVETSLNDERSDGHADFEAAYRFTCRNTDYITGVETQLFEAFPGIEHLRVQFIKGIRQGATHLTHEKNRIDF